jgi:hypothetical protein
MTQYVNLVEQTLTEMTGVKNYTDPDQFIKDIKKSCKPFLKHKRILYRGMHGYEDMGKRKVRKKRRPKDSTGNQDIFINTFLGEKKLPLRSNSIFTSTDDRTASEYGSVYLVFPVGKFRSMYFNTIEDLYADFFEDFDGDGTLQNDYLRDSISKHKKDLVDKFSINKKEWAILRNWDTWDMFAGYIKDGWSADFAIKRFKSILTHLAKIVKNDEYGPSEVKDALATLEFGLIKTLNNFTRNDIGGAGRKEIVIECDEYFFCKEEIWPDDTPDAKSINMEKIVKKQLGLK